MVANVSSEPYRHGRLPGNGLSCRTPAGNTAPTLLQPADDLRIDAVLDIATRPDCGVDGHVTKQRRDQQHAGLERYSR